MRIKSFIVTTLFLCFTTSVIILSCNKATDSVNAVAADPVITALTCSGVTSTGSFTSGMVYSGTASIPYTGGNGGVYAAGTAIASTGVTGLTAALQAGTLATGAGTLVYDIKGTASGTGTASFAISFGGQSCTISISIATSSDCSTATGVAKVVCLANAFLATLSTTQQASVVQTLNLTNARKWSNLPCGLSCRDGIAFSSLSTAQLAAALAVIQSATGTTVDDGYDEFYKINETDSLLGTLAGSGYGKGQYVICFLGTPSTTGKWMLQFGGHHYAGNITYDAGAVVSITPSHQGIEPTSWTTASGATIAPLAPEKAVMADMLASFTSTELAGAKISGTFSDVTLVPGSTTNTFPATKVGIKVSTLSAAAQAKVLAAMMPWVNDMDPTAAAAFTTLYTNELANTYVAYASNTSGVSGNASSFFTTNTDYVRIDGPSVWIEFICQTGVVYRSQIHYHSVYRDHTRDYIGL